MDCIAPECERQARSVKSGLCNTHYHRVRQGEAFLPVAPLLRYAELQGITLKDLSRQKDLPLARADRICCKVFGVHPYAVFGEVYFQP